MAARYYHDEEYDESSDDAVSCDELTYWGEEHFDVLQELFAQFKASGERVFGRAFYQFGDFAEFVHFVKRNTVTESPDLLKPQVPHVGFVGARSRGQHGLPSVQASGHGRPIGDGRE